MLQFNRIVLSVELFAYWYFLAAGTGTTAGLASHVVGTTACVWSIYNGITWHFKTRDGEGLAWAVIGSLVFIGFTARWVLGAA